MDNSKKMFYFVFAILVLLGIVLLVNLLIIGDSGLLIKKKQKIFFVNNDKALSLKLNVEDQVLKQYVEDLSLFTQDGIIQPSRQPGNITNSAKAVEIIIEPYEQEKVLVRNNEGKTYISYSSSIDQYKKLSVYIFVNYRLSKRPREQEIIQLERDFRYAIPAVLAKMSSKYGFNPEIGEIAKMAADFSKKASKSFVKVLSIEY